MLLVAGNTMAQAVRERTSELAVLKTLGFTNRQVLGLVLAESLLLAVLGGGLGLAARRWPIVPSSATRPAASCRSSTSRPRTSLLGRRADRSLLGLVDRRRCRRLQAMRLRIVDALRRV